MALCLSELMVLKDRPYHAIFEPYKLDKQLRILNMVVLTITIGLEIRIRTNTLFNSCVFENQKL